MTSDGRGPFLRTGDLGFLYQRPALRFRPSEGHDHRPRCQSVPAGYRGNGRASQLAITFKPVRSAAFAMNYEGREQLVIVAETVRSRGDDWDVRLQAIRRAVTEEHDLPPDAVYLARNSSVPKTSSGKIQRHACLHAVRDDTLKIVAKWVRWEESAGAVLSGGQAAPMMQAAAARGRSGQITNADVNESIVQAQSCIRFAAVAGERAGDLEPAHQHRSGPGPRQPGAIWKSHAIWNAPLAVASLNRFWMRSKPSARPPWRSNATCRPVPNGVPTRLLSGALVGAFQVERSRGGAWKTCGRRRAGRSMSSSSPSIVA